MKLDNFESALLFYSKGWFKKDEEMDLRRIFNTTYCKHLTDPIYSSHVSKVLVDLIYKIAPTQSTISFPQEGKAVEFLIRLLESIGPDYFENECSIAERRDYWKRVIQKLFVILSVAQTKGKDMEEEIEFPSFEEIKTWIDQNQIVDFEEEEK